MVLAAAEAATQKKKKNSLPSQTTVGKHVFLKENAVPSHFQTAL